MTPSERYKEMLQKAWDGSRGPSDPEKPPIRFSVGFYSGIDATLKAVFEDVKLNASGKNIVDRIDTVKLWVQKLAQ